MVTPASGATATAATATATAAMDKSVEEYLASRCQEQQHLFRFERYKKGADWRGSSSNDNNPQSSSKRSSSTLVSPCQKKRTVAAAPDAQLLELLQWRHTTQPQQCSSKSAFSKRSTRMLRAPKLGVDTIPMTLQDGRRVFIVQRRSNNNQQQQQPDSSTTTHAFQSSCSLGISMKELTRRVTLANRHKMRRQLLGQDDQQQQDNTTTNTTTTTSGSSSSTDDSLLWVDRHAPSSFAQLLSEERTNREVLRALRACWDPYVFGKPAPVRPQQADYYYYNNNNNNQQQQQQKIGNNEHKENTANNNSNPRDKRPPENCRVILLSGPPGVGKTTLAHIVARHAGYRPLEVNASDDRSASVLTERIQRAMESTTLNLSSSLSSSSSKDTKGKHGKNNHHGKPNCLILDEIDGADAKGAIQALADIIKAEIPTKTTKQAKSKVPYLRRPIICICNHKYAPALRPLLPYALHFNVEPPSAARLVARLKTILHKEQVAMMAGGSLLHQLVVATGGVIRSCLFTLQFVAAETTKTGSNQDLSQSLLNLLNNGSGLKDDRNDVTSTITSVFRKVKLLPNNALESTTTNTSSKLSSLLLRPPNGGNASVSRVMSAVEGFADDMTTINALFMNVLHVSYIDPTFDRCSAVHELLSGADMSLGGSEYPMLLRLTTPPVAASIHLLCRVEVKPKLTFSTRAMADSRYQQEANQALIQKFSEGLPVKASHLKCRDLLSKEFIPMALWILSAGEGASSLSRPASSIDILTKAEREVAKRHVAILSALGLSYVPDLEKEAANNTSKYSYRGETTEMKLEPSIDRLVMYQAIVWNQQYRKEIPSNMKMLLAHQLRLENLRRQSDEAMEIEPTTGDADETKQRDVEEAEKAKTSRPKPGTIAAESKGTPRKLDQLASSTTLPDAKRPKSSPLTAGNFLGIAARNNKDKARRRRAANASTSSFSSSALVSKHKKLSHTSTGSGLLLTQVVRMKYVKGFTQAVRTPCRWQDLE